MRGGAVLTKGDIQQHAYLCGSTSLLEADFRQWNVIKAAATLPGADIPADAMAVYSLPPAAGAGAAAAAAAAEYKLVAAAKLTDGVWVVKAAAAAPAAAAPAPAAAAPAPAAAAAAPAPAGAPAGGPAGGPAKALMGGKYRVKKH